MKLLAFTNGQNTFLVPEKNEKMIINLTLLNYEHVIQLDEETDDDSLDVRKIK